MTTNTKMNDAGELMVCIWSGGTAPDPSDPDNWHTLEEFEAELRKAAMHTSAGPNPFTPAGAAKVWARWNRPYAGGPK